MSSSGSPPGSTERYRAPPPTWLPPRAPAPPTTRPRASPAAPCCRWLHWCTPFSPPTGSVPMIPPPAAPPHQPPTPRPHRPPDGMTSSCPPPIWRELAPEGRRQLAQVLAELIRRSRLQHQQREGPGHDAHPER